MRIVLTIVALIFSLFGSSAMAQTARWSRAVCPESVERTGQCVVVIAISAPNSDRSWVEVHARIVEGRTRIRFLFAPDSRVRGNVYLNAGARISDTLNSECNERQCTALWYPTDRQLENLRRESRIVLEFRGNDGYRDRFIIPRQGLMRGLREIQDILDRQSQSLTKQQTSQSVGFALARRLCSECHAVEGKMVPSPNADAPSFNTIASTPGMTANFLSVEIWRSHDMMPNMNLNANERRDLVVYILSLQPAK